jgi:hypothetical protein
MAAKKQKTIVFTLDGEVQPKKSVTRFNASNSNEGVQNIYVSKSDLDKLGDTSNGVRVTIEAL